jgi:capsular polysaccharide biosynthesis protein
MGMDVRKKIKRTIRGNSIYNEVHALYKLTSSSASRLLNNPFVVRLIENTESFSLTIHGKEPEIKQGNLVSTEVSDVYLRPGLLSAYRADGRRVPETRYRSLLGDESREPAEDRSGREVKPQQRIERALFGGIWYGGHFGHFLTETIGRLWPTQPSHEAPADTIVFIVPDDQPEIELATAVRRVLERHFKLVFVKAKVQVTELIVPERTFLGNSFAHSRHKDVAERIWEAVSEGDPAPPRYLDADVYLSRSRLHPGLRRIVNEPDLERSLEARGFTILHPQDLSLAEQVAVFQNARTVCGFIGSAFHTMLLVPPPLRPKVFMVTAGAINRNYSNIDSICRASSTYVRGARPYKLTAKLGSADSDVIADRQSVVDFLTAAAARSVHRNPMRSVE